MEYHEPWIRTWYVLSLNVLNPIINQYRYELKDCIRNKWNPHIYAANWDHLKARVITEFESTLKYFNCDHLIERKGLEYIVSEIYQIAERWLCYYKNEDEFYKSWLEGF